MRTRSRTDGPGFRVDGLDGMFSNMMITCVTPSVLDLRLDARRVHASTAAANERTNTETRQQGALVEDDVEICVKLCLLLIQASV